jgi:predicted transcriptional regulator
MNLGQLIDPTWVQDGRRERFPRAQPAAEPEALAPPGRRPLNTTRKVLEILANASEAQSCRNVRLLLGADLDLPVEQVSAYLSSLVTAGYAEKLGAARPFTYRITELGRQRLR